jgi:hypothetical protein
MGSSVTDGCDKPAGWVVVWKGGAVMVMEKRSNQRRRINTAIVCCRFKSQCHREEIDGQMKNCCLSGFYAELQEPVTMGTVLVVRASGNSSGYSTDEGYRSLALAEVRWSQPKSIKGEVFYATGLKYLMSY